MIPLHHRPFDTPLSLSILKRYHRGHCVVASGGSGSTTTADRGGGLTHMAVAEVRQRIFRTGAPLVDLVAEYASHRLFRNTPDVHVLGNPSRRPLNPDTLGEIDFSRPIGEDEFSSDGSLTANRILLNFYESESIILPASGLATARKDFEAFYDDDLRQTGLALRPERRMMHGVRMPPSMTVL